MLEVRTYGIIAEYSDASFKLDRPTSLKEVYQIIDANFGDFDAFCKRLHLSGISILHLIDGELVEDADALLMGVLELFPIYSAAGFFSKIWRGVKKVVTAPFKVVGKVWNWLMGRKNESRNGPSSTYQDENADDQDAFGRMLTNTYAQNKSIPIVYGEMLVTGLELVKSLQSAQMPKPTAEQIKALAQELKTNYEITNAERRTSASQNPDELNSLSTLKAKIERMLQSVGTSLAPETAPIRYYTDADWLAYYKANESRIKQEYESNKKYSFSGWYNMRKESKYSFSVGKEYFDTLVDFDRRYGSHWRTQKEFVYGHLSKVEKTYYGKIYTVSSGSSLEAVIEREKQKFWETHRRKGDRPDFEQTAAYQKLNEAYNEARERGRNYEAELIQSYITSYRQAWEDGREF